ncbi:MAG: hypothetical protein WD875_15985 [Pirellulales bacterium]
MRQILLASCGLLLALIGMTSDARAIPIPIIWGNDEKMTEMGSLPPEVESSLAEELKTRVTVAFLNDRIHVFYCDLWTWNGRHVLRSGNDYWELTAADWHDLIGDEPAAKYGVPIMYRVPLAPALLALAVVGIVVRKKFFKTEDEKLAALFADERYQKALDAIFADDDAESDKLVTEIDQRRFDEAKSQLVSEGVAAHVAHANLRKMADFVREQTNARIDAHMESAEHFEMVGELDAAADAYAKLVGCLPERDPRHAQARERFAAVQAKLTQGGEERADESPPELA